MTPLQVFLGIAALICTIAGLLLAYALPAWRKKKEAEAAERQAAAEERAVVAKFMSEQVQSGIKVLIGDPGDPEQGIEPVLGIGKRMAQVEARTGQVEAQLKKNGGNSARDMLDKIHEGQQEAAALAADAVSKADQAARFAGQTGIVASRTEQRLEELAAKTDVRHQENTARLDALENNDEDARIQREFLLHLLRTKHGIDLIDDEDDGAADSDGAT